MSCNAIETHFEELTSIFTRHVIWHIIFDFHTFLFKEWGRQNLFQQLFLNISFARLKFAYNVIMQLQYIIRRWKLPQWWLYILFWLSCLLLVAFTTMKNTLTDWSLTPNACFRDNDIDIYFDNTQNN
jgi:hypothetical protein